MVMLASAATASARAGPDRTAAPTGYFSSLRASSSALIAEISASSCSISSPLRRYRRTTPASDAGTYRSRPRAAVFGAKKAYGPCGSPPAHRQPALPHRRVCSVSEPDSTCSAPPSRAARARRRDSSRRVGMPARPVSFLFFCSFITKEYAAARHDDQRPCTARVAAPSAASPSADSRPGPGGSPRSVHACGSVIWPLTPPAQTNTVSAPRRLAYKISSRCPFSGWNGWVTMTKPEGPLDNAALCRLCRHLGGQDRPAGGGRGAERHLRGGLPRLLLRVPAGAQAPRRARCAGGRDREEECELDTRRGHPWLLRCHRPRVAPQVRRAPDRGQAGPAAHPEMAERGSDRGRVVVAKRGGSPARGQRIPPARQRLPALRL